MTDADHECPIVLVAGDIGESKKSGVGFDLYHSNTIEVLERDIGVAKAGDLLICIRNRNLVAAVDLEEERVVWSWGKGELDWPHHPSLLDNGNVLIFDNGARRGYSRVIEVNPSTGEIEWEYRGDPPESFFSRIRGAAQKLPNGNILITESDRGRAFEVTEGGEVVWDFFNPEFNQRGKRMVIYRMMRIPGKGKEKADYENHGRLGLPTVAAKD